MNVRVGLCGFSMSMSRYPEHFPVVEVQNTFYDPPADATMTKWREVTGPDLEYTMKVWQLVTHPAGSPTYRRLKRALAPWARPGFFHDSEAVDVGWQRSLECARLLSATAMLFQCPASFRPTRELVDNMRAFFERIDRPSGVRLLWEPRGTHWVAERELALSLCRDLDLVYVVDPFVTRPEPGLDVYWRLHGKGGARNAYADADLVQLRRMLGDAGSPQRAYVLFNNLPRIGDAKRFAKLV